MLSTELQKAVDDFFDGWKGRVVERLEMGEERYHGKWVTMSADQVEKEMMDEVLDMIAYAIFLRHKTGSDQ